MKQSDGNANGDVKQSVAHNDNRWLQVELDAMRRELGQVNLERARERQLMSQQIELYKERLERADKDKDQLAALLTQAQAREHRLGAFGQSWAGARSASISPAGEPIVHQDAPPQLMRFGVTPSRLIPAVPCVISLP